MGLKEALRLKSFDSTELDVRATRTPKGDPPYLSVVQENLFQIREPTAPIDQGGSAGQGGSGSVPSIRALNVVPTQATAVVGDKGKRSESVSAKGSGSKFVIYGSEHLSVEDKGVHAEEGGEGDNDGTEEQPQLGSGDALDVDSARALEKYVPEWSLANKDRIVDALSAKMALFHLGTPAEHAHYRKMSGPELGNALMLNQAQLNSLVVETYKRWIESESNCRKFEREIANLKSEDNVRSKTKQELSSLRSQVDRLKEQVSEAKEVSKSSQTSAAAAYEARDKALQDLEALKLKFGDMEKKLYEAGKRSKAELKEMQTSYDQLLADHHRLISGRA
ncbi:hypothetical protein HanOQP8_Chr09g0317281 [Helianthus annuus]|nr:hypothetical protein HanOQP8_Chr09g0317281 [Helianthus annuus]